MSGSPSATAASFSASSEKRQDLYLRIQAVDVFVRDLERSLEFYVEQLGFHVVFEVLLQSGKRWVGVGPPDGTEVLTLIATDPDYEQYQLIGQNTEVVFVNDDV